MDKFFFIKYSRTRKRNWDNVGFSMDIVSNVLSRLPVKCLLPFRTVSKLWYRIIGSPSFMKMHLRYSKYKPIYILYPYVDDVTDVYLVNASGLTLKTERITLPGCENLSFLSLICCHNGLVCFTNCPWVPDSNMTKVIETDVQIRICNPATRDVHLLPQGSPSEMEPVVGVAFGLSEYKVFRIFHPKSEPENDRIECEVYSPSTGTWRGIGSVPQCPMHSDNVCIDGTVYWFLVSEEDHEIPGAILSVDIEENFRIIELPEEVTAHAFLIDLDGKLSLVAIYDDDLIMDIWVLRSCSDADYWDRKCSDYIPYSIIEDTDAAAGRKNEVFIITTEHYYIYDIDRRVWTELDFEDAFDRNCPNVFSYNESLLPSNGLPNPEL
ncbi:F-box domain containing protein [Parasponia andersonii]|uniref:F-box domain containing protein n=1 Tax=Parasponia andersonii TaxID=3476 RepID=A0A2P5CK90_PARAD|nr:F-box domain containing protein [Parasponia andersonii]